MMKTPQKKSGFAVLVGRSNVGKSTLLNTLIGTKIAIVTPKPQTTRQPVRGILNEARGQIVFVDTPGIFLGKHDILSQRLTTLAREQLEGIDAIVYVVDPARETGAEETFIQTLLRSLSIPIILVVNKADLTARQKPFLKAALEIEVGQTARMELSALRGSDVNRLIDALFDLMPSGEPSYPAEQKTDLTHPQWLAELIREKLFLLLGEELPYALHVEVTEMEERGDNLTHVAATIWTTEERYKKMVIGARGQMIKHVGSAARKEWEAATGQRLFLDLHVDVDPKWPQRF